MKSVAFACAALAASVPAIAASPKWVPLDSHAAKVMQGQAVSATHKATAAPVASPVASMPQVPAPPAVAVHAIPSPPAIAPEAPVGAGNVGAQIPLQITCFGGGTANKIASATATSIGSVSGSVGGAWINGNTFGTTTISGTRQQAFGDQVDIRLFAGDDRIRLPRTILPPIHGGQAGWFKLKNVVADARSRPHDAVRVAQYAAAPHPV